MNWRQQKEEREREARERAEEERRKKEQKIKDFLQQVPTPSSTFASSGSTSGQVLASAPSSSSPSQAPPTSEPPSLVPQHEEEPTMVVLNSVDKPAAVEGSWTRPSRAHKPASEPNHAGFLSQERHCSSSEADRQTREDDGHHGREEDRDASALVQQLRDELAERDEELKGLKEAYKERLREKEEEFKKRWEVENQAERLAHQLNAAESHARECEDEARRLQEQVNRLTLLVANLRKTKKKSRSADGKKKAVAKYHKQAEHASASEAMRGTKVIALYNFKGAADDGELSFVEGDVIEVIEQVNEGWWEGRLANGVVGIFPFNYTQPLVLGSSSSSGEGDDNDDDELPAHPRMSTLEKVAYAKKKIETKYRDLAKTLSADNHQHQDQHHHHPDDVGGGDASATTVTATAENHQRHEEEHHHHQHHLHDEGEGGEGEASGERAVALFDFEAQNEGELSFRQGDAVLVARHEPDGEWCFGYCHGRAGHFPASYVSCSADDAAVAVGGHPPH